MSNFTRRSCGGPNATWEIALPEGTYDVRVVCGDPSFTDQVNELDVEGQVQQDSDGEDNFDEYLVENLTVSDGRLTIKAAAGASNAKICYVEISHVDISNVQVFGASYDYRTRRLTKTQGASATYFRYDGGVSFQEWTDPEGDGTFAKSVEFVRGSGLGGGIGSILYSERGTDPREYFAYSPAVGHVTATLTGDDPQGTIDVKSTNLYEAFGQVMSYDIAAGWQIAPLGQPTSGQSDNNRLANTKERDVVLGLDNHGFRFYDPEIGRYISRDPIGYQSGTMNLYAYVGNSPVNASDPLGLFGWWDTICALAGVGDPEIVSAARSGAGEGFVAGRAVIANSLTMGMSSDLNAHATEVQAAAARRGDVVSQVGFGLGKVGAEATLSVAGGAVLSPLSKSATAVKVMSTVAKPLAVVGAAQGGAQLGSSVNAAMEGDWNTAVTQGGRAVMSLGAAFDTARSLARGELDPLDPKARGNSAEARVRNDVGAGPKRSVSTPEGTSIPDVETPTRLGDVKDYTGSISNTKQLRIQRAAAQAAGKEHVVYTGMDTPVRSTVTRAGTTVVRRPDLGTRFQGVRPAQVTVPAVQAATGDDDN